MINLSRRQLAQYAVSQMQAGQPVDVVAKQLAAAMVASGKIKDYDLLFSDIEQQFEDKGLMADARITSAHPLPDGYKRQLVNEIKKIAKVNEVTVSQQLDEAVLGGFKIETANRTWDKTIAKLLRTIKETA